MSTTTYDLATTTPPDVLEPTPPPAPVAPAAPEGPTYDLERVDRVTLGRWLVIRRHFELSTDEILTDPAIVLLVCANECTRDYTRGRDEWARFEAMTVDELGALFGLGEAAKSSGGSE